jgi:hypothetical protein
MAGSNMDDKNTDKLKEGALLARKLVAYVHFTDVIGFDFNRDNNPPSATICTEPVIFKALDNETIASVLKIASKAGSILEDAGWQVKY